MEFVKMEGLGNDFVVLVGEHSPSGDDITRWCDRRRGIGADGVLVVGSVDPTVVSMRYWNADGSPAEMCGNGLRCVAALASASGMVHDAAFTVRTPVGDRSAEDLGDGRFRVEVGEVDVTADAVELAGFVLETVTVGNPHAVTFVSDCYAVPVEAVGPAVEGDPSYPDRTNVEFATVVARDRLALRVWERGAGETLACGTGAVAAVAAGVSRDVLDPVVDVILPGGELRVELVDGTGWITGPAREVYRGVFAG